MTYNLEWKKYNLARAYKNSFTQQYLDLCEIDKAEAEINPGLDVYMLLL